MHRVAELLRWRIVGIVPAHIGVVGFVAVGAPMAFVLAGIRIEYDDAMVAVAIGHVHFVGFLIDERFGGQSEVVDVIAAFALPGFADLHQKFAVLGELQNHGIVEVALNAGDLAFVEDLRSTPAAPGGARRRAAAVAADPHVAFVIHRDAVVRLRPVVALARSAPVSDQVAFFIEFENRRGRRAALCRGRIGGGVLFARFERAAAMDDPDMVIGIHRYADRLPHEPMVRQRLGPQRVHLKSRRHHVGGSGLYRGPLAQHRGPHSEYNQECDKGRTHVEIPPHIAFSLLPRNSITTGGAEQWGVAARPPASRSPSPPPCYASRQADLLRPVESGTPDSQNCNRGALLPAFQRPPQRPARPRCE